MRNKFSEAAQALLRMAGADSDLRSALLLVRLVLERYIVGLMIKKKLKKPPHHI